MSRHRKILVCLSLLVSLSNFVSPNVFGCHGTKNYIKAVLLKKIRLSICSN
jgi:hypothetical protein